MSLRTSPDPLHREFAANIPRYFVYTALKGFGFGLLGAMWVIFLTQQRGLSLAQASLVDVMFFVAAAYLAFAGGLGILVLILFGKGHHHLLRSEIVRSDPSEAKA